MVRRRRIRGAGLAPNFAIVVVVAVAVALLVSASVASRRVAAAEPAIPPATKVALFTSPYPDPLASRLEAELAAVGIAVHRVETPPEAQLEAAIMRELAAGAAAAIRVIPRARGTEIWAGDTTTRVSRARSIRADTSDAALSVIALRTVEFLRATLLDVRRRAAAGRATASGGGAGSSASVPGSGTASPEWAGREPLLGASDLAAERAAAAIVTESAASNAAGENRRAPSERPPAGEASAARGGGEARSPSSEAALARAGQTVRPGLPSEESGEAGARATGAGKPRLPEAEARAEAARRASLEASRFEVTAGPALLASPGGLSPIWGASVVGRGRFTDVVGAELMAIFPLTSRRVSIPDVGQLETMPAVFGAAATVRFTPTAADSTMGSTAWVADAAAGVSAIMLRAKGAVDTSGGTGPIASASASSLSAWKPAAHLRIGGGLYLLPWLVLRVDAVGGLCTSRIGVGYVRTDAAGNQTFVDSGSFGPTFGSATLGLQASW